MVTAVSGGVVSQFSQVDVPCSVKLEELFGVVVPDDIVSYIPVENWAFFVISEQRSAARLLNFFSIALMESLAIALVRHAASNAPPLHPLLME